MSMLEGWEGMGSGEVVRVREGEWGDSWRRVFIDSGSEDIVLGEGELWVF